MTSPASLSRRLPAPGRWLAGLFLACALALTPAASAHQMPYTAVLLDLGHGGVSAELVLPLQELELSFKQPLLAHPEQVLPQYDAALRQYLLDHVHPTAPDGRPWTVAVSDLQVQRKEQPFDLVAHLWMQPPAGAPARQFKLGYDVIVHEVVSHKAFVFIRNDWNEARFRPRDQMPPMPEAIGLIRYLVYSVDVNRAGGSFWRGFGSVLALGMQHIAGGLDHLLFLFVLLLPAPLLAAGTHWGSFRGMKPSFVQLLKIVTAFTVGHSLTLLVGGLGWVRLPQRPVEILIAVSILVSAVHAIRPIFAGWEPW
ncbi:MAG: HupE/UreJ family protein, partial [Gluconacetobacter diazotrophicus]|nr:HupE/UreJ family protein [Gluconacetobacter diazotrophicus]